MNTEHSRSFNLQAFSRRTIIKAMGIGAASTVLTPLASNGWQTAQSQTNQSLASQPTQVNGIAQANPNQPSDIITKGIPRTNERIPAIGLGTFLTFDVLESQPRDHIQEVIRRFWEGGGRQIDVSPLYGMSEVNVGEFTRSLGITNELFITNKVWATGEYLGDPSQAQRQLEQSTERLSRNPIDVMQVHSLVDVDVKVPLLRRWKQEGKIRYLGITYHDPLYAPVIEQWIERGELDFVQVRHSIFQREVEERILPAAAERGTAVLANMTLEKGRLFEVVQGQPLPDFAREIDCENWAQFFLKYVISHPSVTAAIPATTNPDHMTENIGAMRRALPDNAMRARMVQHMQTLPGFDRIAKGSMSVWR
jgi:diketogulonate reductase-like aldo/keto reductase